MTDIRNLAAVAAGTDLLTSVGAQLEKYRELRAAIDGDIAKIEGAVDLIENNVPGHEWDGKALRIQNPDGSFGEPVSLEGPPGSPGAAATITIRSVRAAVGNELPHAINVGTPQAAILDLVVPRVVANALNLSIPQNIAYVGQVV